MPTLSTKRKWTAKMSLCTAYCIPERNRHPCLSLTIVQLFLVTQLDTHARTRPLIPSALSFVFLWHASSDSAEVLADAWRRGPADRSWSFFHAWLFRGGADGWVSKVFVSTDARRALPSWRNRQHGGRVSHRYRFESRRGQWALFSLIPSALSFVFLWHTHTHSGV